MQPVTPTVVALVFTDVEGSSRLWERLPDVAGAALEVHDRVLRDATAAESGYEIRAEGDAFKLAFASPAAAARFCLGAQLALRDAPWPEPLLREERYAEVREGDGVAWRGLMEDLRPTVKNGLAGLRARAADNGVAV